MRRRRVAWYSTVGVAIIVIATLLIIRESVTERVYRQTGEDLTRRLPPKLEEKYGEELRYTLDKFWSCYESDIVSQNDLNDVVDRMRNLKEKDDLEDRNVFDFIGFVSRVYTDALHEHHRRTLDEE